MWGDELLGRVRKPSKAPSALLVCDLTAPKTHLCSQLNQVVPMGRLRVLADAALSVSSRS